MTMIIIAIVGAFETVRVTDQAFCGLSYAQELDLGLVLVLVAVSK